MATMTNNAARNRVRVIGRRHAWNRALNERLEREGLQVQNAGYEDVSPSSAAKEALYLFDFIGEDAGSGAELLRAFLAAMNSNDELSVQTNAKNMTSVLLLTSPEGRWRELIASIEPLLRQGRADFVRLDRGEVAGADAWEEVVQRAQLLLDRRAQAEAIRQPQTEAQGFARRILSPFAAPGTGMTELHNARSGRIDAKKVATFFGLPLATLAKSLGVSSQAAHKTPDALSLQSGLAPFHFVASALLGMVANPEHARVWLNAPNEEFDDETPLDLVRNGEIQVVAELLRDALVGQPG